MIKYIYKHENVIEVISKSKFWYSLKFDSVPQLKRAGYSFPPGMFNYHYFDFTDFSDFFVAVLFCMNIASSLLLEDAVWSEHWCLYLIKCMKHHCQNRKCISSPTPLSKALQFVTN